MKYKNTIILQNNVNNNLYIYKATKKKTGQKYYKK